MKKIEYKISATPSSLLNDYLAVMPDFDIDNFARHSNTIPEPLLAPTITHVLRQRGNSPELEWLFNNLGMPTSGSVFVDVFYDDCEISLTWHAPLETFTGYVLAKGEIS